MFAGVSIKYFTWSCYKLQASRLSRIYNLCKPSPDRFFLQVFLLLLSLSSSIFDWPFICFYYSQRRGSDSPSPGLYHLEFLKFVCRVYNHVNCIRHDFFFSFRFMPSKILQGSSCSLYSEKELHHSDILSSIIFFQLLKSQHHHTQCSEQAASCWLEWHMSICPSSNQSDSLLTRWAGRNEYCFVSTLLLMPFGAKQVRHV